MRFMTARGLARVCALPVLLIAATGCGPPADPASGAPPGGAHREESSARTSAGQARSTYDIDPGACLRQAGQERSAEDARCPGFVLEALPDMMSRCSEVGGTLVPITGATTWRLDVDGDGHEEYLTDLTAHFGCDGAPSIFSCSSLGCPYALYGRAGDRWRLLGQFDAMDAPALEVGAQAAGGYRALRGGCAGGRPCDETTVYEWSGAGYEATTNEVRGAVVDIAPGGLWTLVADTSVRALPAADAEVLDRYPAGTEVVLIGAARDSGYRFISPCNACRSGFVPAAAIRKPSGRGE